MPSSCPNAAANGAKVSGKNGHGDVEIKLVGPADSPVGKKLHPCGTSSWLPVLSETSSWFTACSYLPRTSQWGCSSIRYRPLVSLAFR